MSMSIFETEAVGGAELPKREGVDIPGVTGSIPVVPTTFYP